MWVRGNYQRFSGFHAFGDDEDSGDSGDDAGAAANPVDDPASCAAQGLNFDANTGSCYTNVDPGWSQTGVPAPSSSGGGGTTPSAPTGPSGPPPSGPSAPSGPSPGGGGGGGPSPGGAGPAPSMAPGGAATAASMSGSATPWLLGGAVLLGIIYFAAKSHKAKAPHHAR